MPRAKATADNTRVGHIVISSNAPIAAKQGYTSVSAEMVKVSNPTDVFQELVQLYCDQFFSDKEAPEPGAQLFDGGYKIYEVGRYLEIVDFVDRDSAVPKVRVHSLDPDDRDEKVFPLKSLDVYQPTAYRVPGRDGPSTVFIDFLERLYLGLDLKSAGNLDTLPDEIGVHIIRQLHGPLKDHVDAQYGIFFAHGAIAWLNSRPQLLADHTNLVARLVKTASAQLEHLLANGAKLGLTAELVRQSSLTARNDQDPGAVKSFGR